MLQAFDKQTAIRQAGQSVMEGVVLEFLFRQLPLGDITVYDDELFYFPLIILDWAGG